MSVLVLIVHHNLVRFLEILSFQGAAMSKIEYEILQYGIFDSRVKFPEGIITAERMLDYYEIEFYPSDCPGISYVNGMAHRLEKGLIVCGKPGDYRHSRLHFKCCYLYLKVGQSELGRLLNGLDSFTVVADCEEMTSCFYKMVSHSNETVADALFLHSCADRILYALLWLSQTRLLRLPVPTAQINALSAAKDYINHHYSEKLSLDMLSKRIALSPVYFHKLFKNYYGLTPAEYLLKIRLSAAKQLLITTNASAAEIAAECGFSSQSYFNYSFKKQTGVSPIKYRKTMLSQMEL